MKHYLILITLLLLCYACQPGQEAGESQADVSSPFAFDALNYDESLHPFYYGVASGDPASDKVVIWSKVVPDGGIQSVEVDWEVAADSLDF
jgi:alkaline phosphatase D